MFTAVMLQTSEMTMINISDSESTIQTRATIGFILISIAFHVIGCIIILLIRPPSPPEQKRPPLFQIVSMPQQKPPEKPQPKKPKRRPAKKKHPPTPTEPPITSEAAITDTVIKIEEPDTTAVEPETEEIEIAEGPVVPAVDTNRVYNIGEIDDGIVPLFNPQPPYPPIALDMELEGTVEAIMLVNRRGEVTSVKIQKSDRPIFNRSVQRTLLRWKFKPATIDGVPVRVRVLKPIDFHLE